MPDDSPKFKIKNFRCPRCHAISQQQWFDGKLAASTVNNLISHMYYEYRTSITDYEQQAVEKFVQATKNGISKGLECFIPSSFAISTCMSCNDISLWVDEEIVYPKMMLIDPPNNDLDEDIISLYNEAANIYSDSPKGATALLRLALQKILIQVGKEGKSINDDIKELVSEGLSQKIQQALDLLRVVGNNAVHPGQINIDDNSDIAFKLFHILNFIADEMITKPKELDTLYNDIVPEETKGHINRRDGRDGD